jgi:hypothetical protein
MCLARPHLQILVSDNTRGITVIVTICTYVSLATTRAPAAASRRTRPGALAIKYGGDSRKTSVNPPGLLRSPHQCQAGLTRDAHSVTGCTASTCNHQANRFPAPIYCYSTCRMQQILDSNSQKITGHACCYCCPGCWPGQDTTCWGGGQTAKQFQLPCSHNTTIATCCCCSSRCCCCCCWQPLEDYQWCCCRDQQPVTI